MIQIVKNINWIEAPDIGFIPADSHLLKNFTKPNMLDLSVSATEGTSKRDAFSTIWSIVNKPCVMLYSDETLKCEKVWLNLRLH